jgi:hypothetical protein
MSIATTGDGVTACGTATALPEGPFPPPKKLRKILGIFRNTKSAIALRADEYYSFRRRHYTSTATCASVATQ